MFGLGVAVFNGCFLGLHLYGADIKKAMTFETINIQVSNHGDRSQARFGLYIDGFLYYLFKIDGFLVLLFYFNFNKKLEAILEIADHSKLIRDFDKIKIRQNRLKMLKME